MQALHAVGDQRQRGGGALGGLLARLLSPAAKPLR